MPRREELQDEQWKILKPLLPSPPVRTDGRSRPRCDDRAILNGPY
ncbi:MAG: transposase [Gammaproteobacteria bacterium]|nr:transposase [Gammaproteobacteria bacterium]